MGVGIKSEAVGEGVTTTEARTWRNVGKGSGVRNVGKGSEECWERVRSEESWEGVRSEEHRQHLKWKNTAHAHLP